MNAIRNPMLAQDLVLSNLRAFFPRPPALGGAGRGPRGRSYEYRNAPVPRGASSYCGVERITPRRMRAPVRKTAPWGHVAGWEYGGGSNSPPTPATCRAVLSNDRPARS